MSHRVCSSLDSNLGEIFDTNVRFIATGINYSSWALVNFIFNHFIRRRFFAWWTKYSTSFYSSPMMFY